MNVAKQEWMLSVMRSRSGCVTSDFMVSWGVGGHHIVKKWEESYQGTQTSACVVLTHPSTTVTI